MLHLRYDNIGRTYVKGQKVKSQHQHNAQDYC